LSEEHGETGEDLGIALGMEPEGEGLEWLFGEVAAEDRKGARFQGGWSWGLA